LIILVFICCVTSTPAFANSFLNNSNCTLICSSCWCGRLQWC